MTSRRAKLERPKWLALGSGRCSKELLKFATCCRTTPSAPAGRFSALNALAPPSLPGLDDCRSNRRIGRGPSPGALACSPTKTPSDVPSFVTALAKGSLTGVGSGQSSSVVVKLGERFPAVVSNCKAGGGAKSSSSSSTPDLKTPIAASVLAMMAARVDVREGQEGFRMRILSSDRTRKCIGTDNLQTCMRHSIADAHPCVGAARVPGISCCFARSCCFLGRCLLE